ncbi:hypothetical protein TNCV_4742331 [Trichonephila clavipes]|nr:hypothetical protein TNCV_4742331 [Trichonephila clavipes]
MKRQVFKRNISKGISTSITLLSVSMPGHSNYTIQRMCNHASAHVPSTATAIFLLPLFSQISFLHAAFLRLNPHKTSLAAFKIRLPRKKPCRWLRKIHYAAEHSPFCTFFQLNA